MANDELDKMKIAKDKKGQVAMHIAVAEALSSLGKYDEAVASIANAETLAERFAEELEDKTAIAEVLTSKSEMHVAAGNMRSAMGCACKAVEICNETTDKFQGAL